MNNKLIPLCITLVVGIILAGSVLMPVLNDATTTNETITNDGLCRMIEYDDTQDLSILWDYTNPYAITVNDTEYALPNSPTTYDVTILGCESFILRYRVTSSLTQVSLMGSFSGTYNASTSDSSSMTATATGGTIVFDNGSGSTKTETYTDLWCVGQGDYIMKDSAIDVAVKADSRIVAIGFSNTLSKNYRVVVDGSISEGFERTIIPSTTFTNYTLSDVEADYTEFAKYLDVDKFSKLSWTVTDSSDNTATVVYSQIIVPYQVTGELSQHLTPGQIALLGAIPVMVIVALLVVAVGVVARRND